MISTRIIDNDMGAVLKVPLTGIGTIHGITIDHDFVVGKRENSATRKMEDIIERIVLPEFNMGLLEMLSPDKGVQKVTEHVSRHIENSEHAATFIKLYKEFVSTSWR